MRDHPRHAPATGIRLLVADDDRRLRRLFATLLRATAGVASVIEAEDGADAVALAHEQRLDVAVLDLNMPRLDGVEAAVALRALQPSLLLVLQSSDPEQLRLRAAGTEIPLFDKVDFDRVLQWVEQVAREGRAFGNRQARAPVVPKLDLVCSLCGYGIVARRPPARCPLCGTDTDWVELRAVRVRDTALAERLAG